MRTGLQVVTGGFAVTVAVLALQAGESVRYNFRLGETNVYLVQVEQRAEGGSVSYDGHVLFFATQSQPEDATLAFRGNLVVRKARTVAAPYGSSLVVHQQALPPYTELQVDSTGRILAEAGDVFLPLQAGKLGRSLIQPLPDGYGSPRELRMEVSLPDPTPRPGMPWRPPYYDSYRTESGSGSLSADRTTVVRTTAVTAEQADLAWRSEVRSWLEWDGQPRFASVTEGEAALDRTAGVLREVRFDYQETSVTEAVTRRSKLSFQARLLEGEERSAALTSTAPRGPQTWSATEVSAALEALDSREESRRIEAIEKLQNGEFEALPPEVIEMAAALLDSADNGVRWAAGRVVTAQATRAQAPLLLRLLKDTDSPARQSAIEALGRLKEPRAIEPLVELIGRGDNARFVAVQALSQYGPEVEEPVLQLMGLKHLETRRDACQILEKTGTARSLPALQAAMLDPDRMLRDAASQAVGAILARQP